MLQVPKKNPSNAIHPKLPNETKACASQLCEASVPWVCTQDGGQLRQTDSVTHYQLISGQVSPFPVSGAVFASVQNQGITAPNALWHELQTADCQES